MDFEQSTDPLARLEELAAEGGMRHRHRQARGARRLIRTRLAARELIEALVGSGLLRTLIGSPPRWPGDRKAGKLEVFNSEFRKEVSHAWNIDALGSVH